MTSSPLTFQMRGWRDRTVEQRAADAIDWRRLRREVLEPAGQTAGAVILTQGTYSSRPELADMFDFTVLVDESLVERHRRLINREGRPS